MKEENLRQLHVELEAMGVRFDEVEPIRSKEGIVVARVRVSPGGFPGAAGPEAGAAPSSLILKYLGPEEHRREVGNYRMLWSAGIPTLRVFGATGSSLLLEDLEASAEFRLGTAEDCRDPRVASELARWYRMLHERGRELVRRYGTGLYDENDQITRENIERIVRKTNTADLPFWDKVLKNFGGIRRAVDDADRTLTYNDFYFTNLAVARDRSEAMMFDYNMLGKGMAYSDVRNVCVQLSEEARDAFLSAYGPIDQREREIDEVANILVSLSIACKKPTLPGWALEMLDLIRRTGDDWDFSFAARARKF